MIEWHLQLSLCVIVDSHFSTDRTTYCGTLNGVSSCLSEEDSFYFGVLIRATHVELGLYLTIP
jgi:hypothetical protein